MSEPRFQVRSITGWASGGTGGARHSPSTSYWIVDRAYCFREVATFYSPRRGPQWDALRRSRAERVCAELNASVALEDARIHTATCR